MQVWQLQVWTLLQRLLACLNFTLESEDFSLWYKGKKWFLWTMAAAQAVENHGDEWGLNWYFLCGIHTSIPTWTHSQNSLAAAEAPIINLLIYFLILNLTVLDSKLNFISHVDQKSKKCNKLIGLIWRLSVNLRRNILLAI